MSYDLQHVLRQDYFQADNETLSCYDLIMDDIAGMEYMRMGLSEKTAKFMTKTLVSF